MIVWIDAQLSPALAPWLHSTFSLEAASVRELGLRDADDSEIFMKAKAAAVVVMTKDRDFIELLERLGPPPQIIWLTCGNTSNEHLRRLLKHAMPATISAIADGESLVEISDSWQSR